MSGDQGRRNRWILVLLSALTVAAASGWGKVYLERTAAQEEANARLIEDYLAPIRLLLDRNGFVRKELHGSYLVPGLDVLESYVEKVGEDGFVIYSLMKERIWEIDRNNDELAVLLRLYSGSILTEEFSEQRSKYADYARSWGDRWDEVAEAIVAGKALPEPVPYPEEFRRALRKELALREDLL